MKHKSLLAAAAVILGGALHAHSASVLLDFEDGTDQGYGTGFGNDASASFPIVNIGGSLRMQVTRTGGFQQAGNESTGGALLAAANAALLDPSGYVISYDWYVDTSVSPGTYGTFLQLGTYLNSGAGGYAQDTYDIELDGAQLASGLVFSGTVTETLTQKYGTRVQDADFQNQTFIRPGFIINGDGSSATVYYDNFSIAPIPEPTSFALLGLGLVTFCMTRGRRSASR